MSRNGKSQLYPHTHLFPPGWHPGPNAKDSSTSDTRTLHNCPNLLQANPALSQVLLQVYLLILGSLKLWSEETVSSVHRRKRRKERGGEEKKKIGKKQKNLKD